MRPIKPRLRWSFALELVYLTIIAEAQLAHSQPELQVLEFEELAGTDVRDKPDLAPVEVSKLDYSP